MSLVNEDKACVSETIGLQCKQDEHTGGAGMAGVTCGEVPFINMCR